MNHKSSYGMGVEAKVWVNQVHYRKVMCLCQRMMSKYNCPSLKKGNLPATPRSEMFSQESFGKSAALDFRMNEVSGLVYGAVNEFSSLKSSHHL